MSGYLYKGEDLDKIFQKKDAFTATYRSTYKIYQYATDTNMKDASDNDLKDRYISTDSDPPYNSTVDTNVGFTIGDGTDLNAIFSKKTSIIRYEVVMEGERGGLGTDSGALIQRGHSGPPYGADISFNVWLDSSKQYKVKKCFGGDPGTDEYNTENSIRIGGRGGDSLALMEENDTIIAVPGSGGGDGAGNGRRGASVFYRGMRKGHGKAGGRYQYDIFEGGEPDYDYLSHPAPNTIDKIYLKLPGSTIARFDSTTILIVNSSTIYSDFGLGFAPVNGYYYGLTAPYRNHWGGGGGSNSGGVTYVNATNSTAGGKGYGGRGGDTNDWRRSASGGGGGAGMYGGGGGAETNTTDGYRGSPGGGSGSTYYNNADTYGIDIDNDIYPKPTNNETAYITIKNLNTEKSTTFKIDETDYNDENEKIINLP